MIRDICGFLAVSSFIISLALWLPIFSAGIR